MAMRPPIVWASAGRELAGCELSPPRSRGTVTTPDLSSRAAAEAAAEAAFEAEVEACCGAMVAKALGGLEGGTSIVP